MIVLGILLGACVAFVAFCVGYGVGYHAPHPLEPLKIDTRTVADTAASSYVSFSEPRYVFSHDTSRGLLQ